MDEVRQALLREFNRLLAGEELFERIGFPTWRMIIRRCGSVTRTSRAWLNRLILEATFPLAIEKSYTPYQGTDAV